MQPWESGPLGRTVARALLGALVGCTLGTCAVSLGYASARFAPPSAPPQAMLQPGAERKVLTYVAAYVVTGILAGAVWPLRKRSTTARVIVFSAIGGVFTLLFEPAVAALLPNYPHDALPPGGPHQWVWNALAGAALGASLGWRSRRRSSLRANQPDAGRVPIR